MVGPRVGEQQPLALQADVPRASSSLWQEGAGAVPSKEA